MRRVVVALAVTLGMLVLTPSPSWACSCAMAGTAQHVKDAGTVASGTVGWTATDGQTRTYRVDFDAVYKGAAARSEKLVTSANEASCGLAHLVTDKRYLFFIEGRHPGALRVSLCGGTVGYDATVAGQVERITGPPHAPVPTPGDRSGPATSGGTRGLLLGVGALAALLIVAGWIVVRRRAVV